MPSDCWLIPRALLGALPKRLGKVTVEGSMSQDISKVSQRWVPVVRCHLGLRCSSCQMTRGATLTPQTFTLELKCAPVDLRIDRTWSLESLTSVLLRGFWLKPFVAVSKVQGMFVTRLCEELPLVSSRVTEIPPAANSLLQVELQMVASGEPIHDADIQAGCEIILRASPMRSSPPRPGVPNSSQATDRATDIPVRHMMFRPVVLFLLQLLLAGLTHECRPLIPPNRVSGRLYA